MALDVIAAVVHWLWVSCTGCDVVKQARVLVVLVLCELYWVF